MRTTLPACVALLFISATAGAQQTDQSEDTRLPLWEVGVLGGAASTPAYPGAENREGRAIALPWLIYRGKILRADQSGVGARLLRTERTELDLGFALSLPSRSEHSEARKGMPDLDSLVEFGPRLKVKLLRLDEHSGLRFEAPLRAVFQVRGLERQGYTFEPKLVYETGRAGDWAIDASVGVVAGSKRLQEYFYSVEPQYATAARPAYAARGGMMMARTTVGGWHALGKDWRVFGFLRYDNYSNASNGASPLMRQNSGLSAGMGFAWTLRRSEARVTP